MSGVTYYESQTLETDTLFAEASVNMLLRQSVRLVFLTENKVYTLETNGMIVLEGSQCIYYIFWLLGNALPLATWQQYLKGTCLYINTHTHTCKCTCTCTHARAHTHAHTRTSAHAHTHTHTHLPALQLLPFLSQHLSHLLTCCANRPV